jgi:hypothetical protein
VNFNEYNEMSIVSPINIIDNKEALRITNRFFSQSTVDSDYSPEPKVVDQ